ncbi:cytochrome P450 4C1-like [Zophobas morio]|uniref:cytochrome P450 4C1-like n=1 Tax=Zophobas morio TaxID=2755281 RepID=UPI003082FFF9
MVLTPVLIFVVFLIIYATFFRKRGRFWECLSQLPKPPAYPIIGNLFEVMRTPEQMFVHDRKRGLQYYPLYHLDVLGVGSANILNPEDMEVVLTDMKQNTKSIIYEFLHSWLGTGLLTSAGSKWQSRRKILTPAFHFNILQEFVTIFTEETKRLVDELEKDSDKPYIDVVVPITQFTLMSIGETAMGINFNSYMNDKDGYKKSIYDIGRLLTYRAPRPWIYSDAVYSLTSNSREEKKVVKTLHQFTNDVIAKRKSNFSSASYSERKRLAMLDLLLKYRAEGANIDDEGIREEVDTFMFEGHDTTSMAICFALMLLANHRDVQNEIYNEIEEVLGEDAPSYSNLHELKYLERCLKESLRLYPSVPFISRVSGSEVKTKTGYTIPNDCMINLQIYDMHHNPNVFPDPEKFDPDRFLPENIQKRHPFAYIPFSAGSRNCIGQKFAMLEMKTAICGILKKFILEPVDTPKDMVFITDLVLRPKGSIKVKFVPRR